LAAREIDINPKGFVQRETITRSMSKLKHLDSGHNELFYSMMDSNSRVAFGDTDANLGGA